VERSPSARRSGRHRGAPAVAPRLALVLRAGHTLVVSLGPALLLRSGPGGIGRSGDGLVARAGHACISGCAGRAGSVGGRRRHAVGTTGGCVDARQFEDEIDDLRLLHPGTGLLAEHLGDGGQLCPVLSVQGGTLEGTAVNAHRGVLSHGDRRGREECDTARRGSSRNTRRCCGGRRVDSRRHGRPVGCHCIAARQERQQPGSPTTRIGAARYLARVDRTNAFTAPASLGR